MRLLQLIAPVASLFAGTMTPSSASADVEIAPLSQPAPASDASRPEKRATIEVGDVLQAKEDVELDEAVIMKGSKISVSRKSKAAGRVLLDVALADGHVVRGVPLTNILKSFERAP